MRFLGKTPPLFLQLNLRVEGTHYITDSIRLGASTAISVSKPLPLVCWVGAGPQGKGCWASRPAGGPYQAFGNGNGPVGAPLIPRYEMWRAHLPGVDVGGEDGHSVHPCPAHGCLLGLQVGERAIGRLSC